jgi:hypothetical protein
MPYDLNALGPLGFQDLAGAILVSRYGPGITALGPGRDGGRDLVHRGHLNWQQDLDVDATEGLDGYTVFQVKHKANNTSGPTAAAWLWGQMHDELELWLHANDRTTIPDTLIFITNVDLTAYPVVGGFDVIEQHIATYRARVASRAETAAGLRSPDASKDVVAHRRLRSVKTIRVWDSHQLQIVLHSSQAVRNAFPAFLTAADVFANLAQFTENLPISELQPALLQHARTSLSGESSIYFDQAGSGDGAGYAVHDVVVDLPLVNHLESPEVSGAARESVMRVITERAERLLKPSLATHKGPRHLVLTGAPGNGKTTISRFVTQLYRAAMLNGHVNLSTDQKAIIDGTRAAMDRFSMPFPKNRRWPLRVDLAQYAQTGGGDMNGTLTRWIAATISKRTDLGVLTPRVMSQWFKQWPCLLILDGLDEVTDPEVRKTLITQVTEFVHNSEADDNDLLVIITTRPVGYTESISPSQFQRIDLDYLSPIEGLEYGEVSSRVRLRGDIERYERVIHRLRAAALDRNLQKLLRTPLQVLIITIILDNAGTLPPDRYGLFWSYFDAVYKRERDKVGGYSDLLKKNHQQVQALHELVGFRLQSASEVSSGSEAVLSPNGLRAAIREVLEADGYKPESSHSRLVEDIYNATTKRLLLLAPRGDDGYGFDVRSLQELNAARYLTRDTDAAVLTRLDLTMASPHWRNTWLFAAGRWFADNRSHQLEELIDLLGEGDKTAPWRLGRIFPTCPMLALEVLDDGMADSRPAAVEKLVRIGLSSLEAVVDTDLPDYAVIVGRVATRSDDHRGLVAAALREALVRSRRSHNAVKVIQHFLSSEAQVSATPSLYRGLAQIKSVSPPQALQGARTDWDMFDLEIQTASASDGELAALAQASDALKHGGVSVPGINNEVPLWVQPILKCLGLPNAAVVLEAALGHVAWYDSTAVSYLRYQIVGDVYRRPVAEKLS